jgi:hypothetical protein
VTSRVLHILENTDMRARHEGLRDFAKKNKVDISKMNEGDIVVFLNAKKDRLMCLVVLPEEETFGFLGYYRSPHGRVPPEALEFIPRAFGGSGFNMNASIRAGLTKLLAKKGIVKSEEEEE